MFKGKFTKALIIAYCKRQGSVSLSTPEAELVAVTVGPTAAQEQLRTALAMGADRAIHVVTDEQTLPIHVAKIFKALVEKEEETAMKLRSFGCKVTVKIVRPGGGLTMMVDGVDVAIGGGVESISMVSPVASKTTVTEEKLMSDKDRAASRMVGEGVHRRRMKQEDRLRLAAALSCSASARATSTKSLTHRA